MLYSIGFHQFFSILYGDEILAILQRDEEGRDTGNLTKAFDARSQTYGIVQLHVGDSPEVVLSGISFESFRSTMSALELAPRVEWWLRVDELCRELELHILELTPLVVFEVHQFLPTAERLLRLEPYDRSTSDTQSEFYAARSLPLQERYLPRQLSMARRIKVEMGLVRCGPSPYRDFLQRNREAARRRSGSEQDVATPSGKKKWAHALACFGLGCDDADDDDEDDEWGNSDVAFGPIIHEMSDDDDTPQDKPPPVDSDDEYTPVEEMPCASGPEAAALLAAVAMRPTKADWWDVGVRLTQALQRGERPLRVTDPDPLVIGWTAPQAKRAHDDDPEYSAHFESCRLELERRVEQRYPSDPRCGKRVRHGAQQNDSAGGTSSAALPAKPPDEPAVWAWPVAEAAGEALPPSDSDVCAAREPELQPREAAAQWRSYATSRLAEMQEAEAAARQALAAHEKRAAAKSKTADEEASEHEMSEDEMSEGEQMPAAEEDQVAAAEAAVHEQMPGGMEEVAAEEAAEATGACEAAEVVETAAEEAAEEPEATSTEDAAQEPEAAARAPAAARQQHVGIDEALAQLEQEVAAKGAEWRITGSLVLSAPWDEQWKAGSWVNHRMGQRAQAVASRAAMTEAQRQRLDALPYGEKQRVRPRVVRPTQH